MTTAPLNVIDKIYNMTEENKQNMTDIVYKDIMDFCKAQKEKAAKGWYTLYYTCTRIFVVRGQYFIGHPEPNIKKELFKTCHYTSQGRLHVFIDHHHAEYLDDDFKCGYALNFEQVGYHVHNLGRDLDNCSYAVFQTRIHDYGNQSHQDPIYMFYKIEPYVDESESDEDM